jgi:ribonuclease R
MRRSVKKNKKVEKKSHLVPGLLRVHPRGFGFLVPKEREKYPVDIFIPKQLTKGAVDGDIVEVEINEESISEKGPEGKVINILERGRSHLAGIVVRLLSKDEALAYIPLLGSAPLTRIVKSQDRKLILGDRIVIHMLEWGTERKEGVGEMSAYLGNISDPSVDVPATIHEYGLPSTFPTKVIEEAKSYGDSVQKSELKDREDLTKVECFTIDPETAKDYDDALSLTRDKKGIYHLGVHIADVSHYVKPDTFLDQEARGRCNSVYLPGTVVPMLPHDLSSHLCSLKADVNRLTVSVHMRFDKTGELLDYEITRSVINSQKRFTYSEAKEVLDGLKKSKHAKTLALMSELCFLLKKKRYERGSIEFSVPSTQLYINAKGETEKIELVEYDITHQLVEEFMLKANEVVATHLSKQGKQLTYRVHDEPNPENIKDFALLANTFGFPLSSNPTTEELQTLFDEARSSPFGQFLATAFIKSMKLAAYSVQNIGHYGLGLEYYTHFTSPIRRYIDLIVHRLLFDEAEGENLEAIAQQCSDKERLSAKAENAATLLKKLRLLDRYQKEDPHHVYEAVIIEIKPFGIIFEVIELFFEGFLPLSQLENDYYSFDQKGKRLVGNHHGHVYKAGDKIEVNLYSVDLVTQDTKWQLVFERKESSKKGKGKRKGRRK